MNLRFKPDPGRSWRDVNLLLVWLVVVVEIAFLDTFAIWILCRDSPGNSVNGWLGFISMVLFSGGVWATVIVGIWAFIRGVSGCQNFKRLIFQCSCIAALITLFYAEEDWRGKHEWEKFKREWEARGENFDRDSVVPRPVPDDENFAMSPIWIAGLKRNYQMQSELVEDWYQTDPGLAEAWYGNGIYSDEVSNYFRLVPISVEAVVVTNSPWMGWPLPSTPDTWGDWTIARMTDLSPWQWYYRNLAQTNSSAGIAIAPRPQTPAQDVLLALSKYDPAIERLRRDSRLPYSRFPIDYSGDQNSGAVWLPHLDAIKESAKVLELRAIAELQNGQNDKALADVNLTFRLADAVRTEPFLLSQLVRIAVVQIAVQPIYEGLANHDWSNSQLTELDSELSHFDFLTDYKFSLRGDMIISLNEGIDFLYRHPGIAFEMRSLGEGDDLVSDQTPGGRAIGSLIPAGWFYQNKLNDDRTMEEFYLPIADTDHDIISPTAVGHAWAAVEAETYGGHVGPYNVLERCMGGLPDPSMRVAFGQNAVNLCRVAIALERYRMAHGQIPSSLDGLVPQFIVRLPHDIINGQPLHYRPTANGQFILYSVGWNEKDDGGTVVLMKKPMYGDWVWRYPEK